MMQCIIIDNELNAIKSLTLDLLPHAHQVEIIGKFTSAENAIPFLNENKVDIVFLDIEMPVLNGLQFLDHFPDSPFFTVFTTAHSDYAIEAIKRSAIDYLLKPIDADELALCLERIQNKFDETILKQNPIVYPENNGRVNDYFKKIKIFTEGKILFLDPEEILYCKAEGSYTTLFCQEKNQVTISQNLKVVVEWLPSSIFIRVHNSYIINRKKIKEFHRQENYLILEDNSSIPVSRQKKNEILNLL